MKGSYSRSLTVRNLQLSLFGLPFSLAYALVKDGRGGGGADGDGSGFMRGFDALAWSVVALQVCRRSVMGPEPNHFWLLTE